MHALPLHTHVQHVCTHLVHTFSSDLARKEREESEREMRETARQAALGTGGVIVVHRGRERHPAHFRSLPAFARRGAPHWGMLARCC